ncbi:hypothetical protein OPQ81_008085 [Rhizoctonia solani]|nr:hypothetical protein OPQ81_008085 [Rhizoctonia solani]
MSQDQQPDLLDNGLFPDLQFTVDDLEGVDFDAVPDSDVTPWLKDLLEAHTPVEAIAPLDAGQTAGQPSPTQNQEQLSITVQDKNGRKSSKEIPWDPSWDDLLQEFRAEAQADQQAPVLEPQPQPQELSPLVFSSLNLQGQLHRPGKAPKGRWQAQILRPGAEFVAQTTQGRPPLPPDIAAFINPQHTPRNHGRVPDRRGVKDTTIANDFYYSISHLPALTLPYSGKIVTYSGVEFEPKMRFTANEFLEYLDCATQWPDNAPSPYPAHPDPAGPVQPPVRICIQEFDDERGDWLNPYHNAGYAHLYCLEHQLNLIELFRNPRVVIIPEDRKFEHEPPATMNPRTNNPMALNDLEKGVVEAWVEEIGARWDAFTARHPDVATRPPFLLEDKDYLFHRLTAAHLENPSTKIIQRKRKIKAGGKLTNHLDQESRGQNAPAAVPELDTAPEPPARDSVRHGISQTHPVQDQPPSAALPAGPSELPDDGYADDYTPGQDNHLPQHGPCLSQQDSYVLQQNTYLPQLDDYTLQQDNYVPVGPYQDYPLDPLLEGELPMPFLFAADEPVSTPRAGSHPGRRSTRTSPRTRAARPGPRTEQAGVRKSPRRRSPRFQAEKAADKKPPDSSKKSYCRCWPERFQTNLCRVERQSGGSTSCGP